MNLYRYEKEMMHPVQNLFNGELARAMLIQVLFYFIFLFLSLSYLSTYILFFLACIYERIELSSPFVIDDADSKAQTWSWDVSEVLFLFFDWCSNLKCKRITKWQNENE